LREGHTRCTGVGSGSKSVSNSSIHAPQHSDPTGGEAAVGRFANPDDKVQAVRNRILNSSAATSSMLTAG
jgi:hypothetical protein